MKALWLGFIVYEHDWCPVRHTLMRMFTVADSQEKAAELMTKYVQARLEGRPTKGYFNICDVVGPWLGFQRIPAPELANTLAMYGFAFVDPSSRPKSNTVVSARVKELLR